jgi:hypothetical protein
MSMTLKATPLSPEHIDHWVLLPTSNRQGACALVAYAYVDGGSSRSGARTPTSAQRSKRSWSGSSPPWSHRLTSSVRQAKPGGRRKR